MAVHDQLGLPRRPRFGKRRVPFYPLQTDLYGRDRRSFTWPPSYCCCRSSIGTRKQNKPEAKPRMGWVRRSAMVRPASLEYPRCTPSRTLWKPTWPRARCPADGVSCRHAGPGNTCRSADRTLTPRAPHTRTRFAGPQLHLVGGAENLERGPPFDTERRLGALHQPRPENRVIQVRLSLRDALDRVPPGRRAEPQPINLREDIPHPVRALRPLLISASACS